MTHTVHLHVGPAKSGTTYLQRVMFVNGGLLRENGVLYPGSRASHFMPVLDLKGKGFKGHRYPQAEGQWDRLASQVRDFDGASAVISHETLARTSPEVMRAAVDSFPGSEVRVLITCRDLGRQIPATWQENVKNRNQTPYGDFLARTLDTWRRGKVPGSFWGAQDLARLARRWGRVVGPGNVRLVTVPPPGSPPTLLWERFAEAAGFPELDYDLVVSGGNPSLGAVQAELLRRLNTAVPETVGWRDYERRIKGAFVRELRTHPGDARLTVPEEFRSRVDQVADEMIGDLRRAGYAVVGDLEDLRPSYLPVTKLPDEVGDDELLALALRSIADLALREPEVVVERRPQPSGRQALRMAARAVRRRFS